MFISGTALGARAKEAPDPEAWLNVETFFTTLRKPERSGLKEQLWPESTFDSVRARLRDRELRRMLFSTMARKGHPIIDLFILVANGVDSIVDRRRESAEEGSNTLAEAFLDLLDSQRRARAGSFHSFAELSAAAANFELIVTQNLPELRDQPLSLAPNTARPTLTRAAPDWWNGRRGQQDDGAAVPHARVSVGAHLNRPAGRGRRPSHVLLKCCALRYRLDALGAGATKRAN